MTYFTALKKLVHLSAIIPISISIIACSTTDTIDPNVRSIESNPRGHHHGKRIHQTAWLSSKKDGTTIRAAVTVNLGYSPGAVGNHECQESVMRFARDAWACIAQRAWGGGGGEVTRFARGSGETHAVPADARALT